MFTEAQNFAIVQTELDDVFKQVFEYADSFPSMATANTAAIFKPATTTHAAVIREVFKGTGLFPVIGETSVVPTSTPKVANKFTSYVKDFADSIQFSKDLFDDNMHGVYAKMVEDFLMSARITQDANAFALFNGGFTTTLTADGNALFSTHTLIGGGTVVNNATGALTDTNLNTAIVALRQQKNQAGVGMGNTPTVLLVPSPLYKKAIQLTESALLPDSANNNINVYRSAYGMTVYTSIYLDSAYGGSDTAWFLLSRNHAVTRTIRQGVEAVLTDWSYSTNRTYNYQANFREVVDCIDYVGSYGSTGTTA